MNTKPNEPEEDFDDFVVEELDDDESIAVEEVDDTPEEDRDRAAMPKELVDELENDDLGEYSEKVKQRLKQMKKVWHDERREKERIQREQQEAVNVAKRALDENRYLKNTLSAGEKTLLESYKHTAQADMAAARQEYIAAHETGDSEALVRAQERITSAAIYAKQLEDYKPSRQQETEPVYEQQVAPVPRLDPKTEAWQKRNTWWGTDSEMTAAALGLHQKLEQQNGKDFVGSDEYWRTVDTTMQRRFPEYFGDAKPARNAREGRRPTTVVAPATRSTASRKVVLTKTQVALAKKFGLTPEQYAREAIKLENRND